MLGQDPRDDVVLVQVRMRVMQRELGLADPAQPRDRLRHNRQPIHAEGPLKRLQLRTAAGE